MTAIAGLGLEVTLVATTQVTRLILMFLIMPNLIRFLLRLKRKEPSKNAN
jgi:uncharacterized membrane protein AbrB (regulator of aidB expression)